MRVTYVDADYGDRIPDGLLLVWPAGFGWAVDQGVVRVLDGEGPVVANVENTARIVGRLTWSVPEGVRRGTGTVRLRGAPVRIGSWAMRLASAAGFMVKLPDRG